MPGSGIANETQSNENWLPAAAIIPRTSSRSQNRERTTQYTTMPATKVQTWLLVR